MLQPLLPLPSRTAAVRRSRALLPLFALWATLQLSGVSAWAAIAVGTTLPQGIVGQPFSATLAATGGSAPYTHAMSSGNLPPGLTLTPAGVIAGTPFSAGQYSFAIQSTDAVNQTGATNLTILVTSATGPTITTNSLLAGMIGTAYTATLGAQGGATPYSWDLILGGGALPPGLTLSSNGTISGTATQAGVFPITVRATDANGNPFQASFLLRINAAALAISTTSLAGASSNVPYSQALTAVGGTPPYTFELLSGSLPSGVTITPAGIVNGIPATAGTYNFFARVTDSVGATAQASYSLVVAGTGPRIVVSSLPTGIVNQPFSGGLIAQGGTAPYTFTVLSGSLPAGVTLSSTGSITGTPTAGGVFPITVRLTDATGQTATSDVLININAGAFAITPLANSGGFVGTAYSRTLATTGGTGPVTFSLLTGALPPGVTFNPNGTFTGSPSTAGTYQFVVRASDAAGGVAQLPIITIIQASSLTISQAGLANGRVGQIYSSTLSAQNGASPYQFALVSGALPPGLTLATNGNISGTPTAAGVFLPVIRVVDGNQASAQVSAPIFVAPASSGLTVTTLTVPSARPNQPYNTTLQAIGGTPPYTFQLDSGTLPSGLTLSPSGLLSGTPTQTTNSTLAVRVTDGSGATAIINYAFLVNSSNITLTSAAFPAGRLGTAYSASFTTTGGSGTVTYALESGALPPGLTLSGAGALTGTPSATGTYLFNIRATDANQQPASFAQLVTIGGSELAFSSLQFPAITTGTAYTATLSGVGGTPPYTFTLVSGSLPPGLTLAANGGITGTAMTSGAYPVTLRIADSAGATATGNVTFLVQGPTTPGFSSVALPALFVGQNYRTSLQVTGGVAPFTFSVLSGSLPAGLTLSPQGVLSGIPTSTGQSTVTFRVIDANGASAVSTMTLGATLSTLNFGFSSIPTAVVGQNFTFAPTATGGSTPYTFSAVSGLPTGLAVSASGAITGTPTQEGTFFVLLRARDANGVTVESTFPLTVAAAGFRISTATLPNAVLNQSYSRTIETTGGTGAVTFMLQSGTLPAGLTLVPNGMISGIPTAVGTSTFTVRAVDTANASTTGTLTLIVSATGPSFSTNSLLSGTVGQAYSQTLAVTGGSSHYTFAMNSGTLPPGVTLSTGGQISGSPTTTGTYTFSVIATDASGLSSTSDFLIGIGALGAPNVAAVVSSANYAANGVAPGEIVVIYGTNIGPSTLVSFTLNNNMVGTTLSGTRVLFDGVASPIVYTSSGQVAAVVPFSVFGKNSVVVTVESQGTTSAAIRVPVRNYKPAIFTLDASGTGPGAILNQDATVNGTSTPAERQSIVSLYMTGLGQTNPASVDGLVVSTPANLLTQVTATVNGQPAEVVYAGNAPTLIPGVAQVNLRLPAGTTSGANRIAITAGGVTTTSNVTIFVR